MTPRRLRSTAFAAVATLCLLTAPLGQAQTAPAAIDSPPVNTYFSSGSLRSQVEQTRSRRVERSFFVTGVMERETTYAMNGEQAVREREVVFAPTGVMLKEQRWARGEPTLDNEFLASGVLIRKREYHGLGSTRELQVQTFYASGVLASEERYAAPSGSGQLTPIGVQKTFDNSGRPLTEKIHDLQGRLVSERQRSGNGEWITVAPSPR